MCGIVAHFAAEPGARRGDLVADLALRLRHRGPDGLNSGSLGRASLAHARLAIVDVTGGSQPMHGDRGSLLVCNGEIYNHLELRSRLAAQHHFESRSDSEAIVHLYEDFGSAAVAQLDGMFAFFVTDGSSFVAARDPFGIKPLYYGHLEDGAWLFASEMKVVAEHCHTFATLNPGSLITDVGKPVRWFHREWETSVGTRLDSSPADLARRLDTAVAKRLMSDVPLGVFLSGGLDSSIVGALVRRHSQRVTTFSVGTRDSSDLEAARIMANALGASHYELVYSAVDVAQALTEVILRLESYDAALIRSAIPCYLLSRLAAEHVKIVLTGEGADELFGGYGYFSGIDTREAFHRECVRLLSGLHSMNLQRVDRMTMAHGLEGRVPFLDTEFIDFVMGIDPVLKMWGGVHPEKALLRAAFADALPSQILVRRKQEFSRGSGVEPALKALAAERISDHDILLAAARFPIDPPRDKEELLYREIFSELFPGEGFRAAVARWRPELASSQRGISE